MQRVMCIKDKYRITARNGYNGGKDIRVGDIYTVSDIYEENRKMYYILIEMGQEYAYSVNLFGLISDLDESVIHEQIKELV